MALNFVVSYTFSSGTTISSAQVNTNTSDVANVFTGLEALTKSFSNLRVDTTPTATTDVAIKSYVDKLNNYRRPVLQYSSGTVVNLEAGINGTSGQAQILFPDGTLRTDSTTTRINCNLAQNAVLSGTAQSGLRTGSQTANTWYSFYAVKVTDSTTNFVTVADTVLPLQANYATLNSNFGTNGWAYLGTLPNGNGLSANNVIPKFIMAGHRIALNNANGGNVTTTTGIQISTTASATTITWSYAAGGTVGTNVPAHILIGDIILSIGGGTTFQMLDSANNQNFVKLTGSTICPATMQISNVPFTLGFKTLSSSATTQDLLIAGYVDGVLGVGANPIL